MAGVFALLCRCCDIVGFPSTARLQPSRHCGDAMGLWPVRLRPCATMITHTLAPAPTPTISLFACLIRRLPGHGRRFARPVGAGGHPRVHEYPVSRRIAGSSHAHRPLGVDPVRTRLFCCYCSLVLLLFLFLFLSLFLFLFLSLFLVRCWRVSFVFQFLSALRRGVFLFFVF